MKKLVSILLVTALMAICLGVPALAASYVYFTGSCHVYKGPGRGYDNLGIVKKGSTLPYKGNSKKSGGTTWYNVTFNGKSGWVSSKYGDLTNQWGSAEYASGGTGGSTQGAVTGSFESGKKVYINGNVNVRKGPSLSDDRIGTAYKGDVLTGTGSISTDSRGIDWYSVKFNGKKGWVSSVYASLKKKSGISYGSGSSSSSSSSSGKKVVGDGGKSNVRKGPGLDYDKVGVLHEGESAAYAGKKSVDDRGVTWYKIKWHSSTAWVSSMYTTLK